MDAIFGSTWGGVSLGDVRFNNDDDFSDKMSHRYTPILFVLFAVLVTTTTYVGDPINCWVPAHFSDPWEEYSNSYCWVKNTYKLPLTEDVEIPKAHEDHEYLTYYQWVPLLILAQALFFIIPRRIWRTLNSRCAVDLDNLVEQAVGLREELGKEDEEDPVEAAEAKIKTNLIEIVDLIAMVNHDVENSENKSIRHTVQDDMDKLTVVGKRMKPNIENIDVHEIMESVKNDLDEIITIVDEIKKKIDGMAIESPIQSLKERLKNLNEKANETKELMKTPESEAAQHLMIRQMHRFLESSSLTQASKACTCSLKDLIARVCCPVCGRTHSNYLVFSYLFCKILFLANAVGQLFLLDVWLGSEDWMYGASVLNEVIHRDEYEGSIKFPRVTMCDFLIRRLGNIHRYTVQCVLSINLFNEMIYLFIWFWILLLAIISFFSLLGWTMKLLMPSQAMYYIKKHLNYGEQLMKPIEIKADEEEVYLVKKKEEDEMVKEFVKKYLAPDGTFICRLINVNTDEMIAATFICGLWKKFKKEKKKSNRAEKNNAGKSGSGLDQPDGSLR